MGISNPKKHKKKRVRANKGQDAAATKPFTLSVDMFEQFGLIQLNPPVNIDQVPKSIEDLRAKKTWFAEQKRGSVPTAVEIRKKTEKGSKKSQTNNSQNNKKKNVQPKKDDFLPSLGNASTAVP